MIKIKSIYKKQTKDDGYRIFIDQLWPRDMKKEHAGVDLWLRDIEPSSELRAWFSNDATKWDEFKKCYQEELKGKKELIELIKCIEQEKQMITFLFAASDKDYNNAIVLKETILGS